MAVGDEQRQALRAAKLAALIRAAGAPGVDVSAIEPAGGAASAVVVGPVAHLLTEQAGPGAVSGALLWADRHGASSVRLYVDDLAGDVARWAELFDADVEVRQVTGATSVPATAEPPTTGTPGAVADDAALRAELRDAGLDVVEEHGVVTGEVRGLEVARLVVWPASTGGDDAVHIEAGVGRFDRDATAAMHDGESPEATLRRAIDLVEMHRTARTPTHPLALMARERWLRHSVLERPALVGASELEPIATTVLRTSVREPSPAAALGRGADGSALVVVCSVGADLSLVPVAADTRAQVAPDATLVLVVPERDRLPSTERLVSMARGPVELRSVTVPWETAPEATS